MSQLQSSKCQFNKKKKKKKSTPNTKLTKLIFQNNFKK
jgi:hypothetical protein